MINANAARDIVRKLATDIREGEYIMIDGNICQVKSISFTRPGRHGRSKFTFEGTDLVTGEERELANINYHDNVDRVNVRSREFTVIDFFDNNGSKYVTVMDTDNDAYRDFTVPDNEIRKEIEDLWEQRADIDVRVAFAAGKEVIVSCYKMASQ